MIFTDVVLNQFCEDFPFFNKIYIKSDNASSYHGNYCLEVLYNICKNKNITLLRYDYEEPCCGKDQCDRESIVCRGVNSPSIIGYPHSLRIFFKHTKFIASQPFSNCIKVNYFNMYKTCYDHMIKTIKKWWF